jgi:hypothetical protein
MSDPEEPVDPEQRWVIREYGDPSKLIEVFPIHDIPAKYRDPEKASKPDRFGSFRPRTAKEWQIATGGGVEP